MEINNPSDAVKSLYTVKAMEEMNKHNEAVAQSKDAARETKFTLEKEDKVEDDKRKVAKAEHETVVDNKLQAKENPKAVPRNPFGIA
jgi:hypothetical protein